MTYDKRKEATRQSLERRYNSLQRSAYRRIAAAQRVQAKIALLYGDRERAAFYRAMERVYLSGFSETAMAEAKAALAAQNEATAKRMGEASGANVPV